MTARNMVLASIRARNHIVCPATSRADLPQVLRSVSTLDRTAMVALFEDRLLDYGATVRHCSAQETGKALAQLLNDIDARVVLVARDFNTDGIGPQVFEWKRDEELPHQELECCDAVLTTSTLGIAETGTIVLQNSEGQGRRAMTLLPDVHVCVVQADHVVATVPEAFARLETTSTLPTTFISGPSATADIEMTRIQGVHGPRFLHVLVVDGMS